MQAVAEQQARLRAEQARDRRKSSFRAAPPPGFRQPPPLARSERPATRALTPKLAVKTRSTERAIFDAMAAENRRKDEVSKSGHSSIWGMRRYSCLFLRSHSCSRYISCPEKPSQLHGICVHTAVDNGFL